MAKYRNAVSGAYRGRFSISANDLARNRSRNRAKQTRRAGSISVLIERRKTRDCNREFIMWLINAARESAGFLKTKYKAHGLGQETARAYSDAAVN